MSFNRTCTESFSSRPVPKFPLIKWKKEGRQSVLKSTSAEQEEV